MSYHMLYDEDGRPQKAIGIKEDLSYMPAQQRSVQRRVMPADLYPHLYCYLQANITTDKVEKLLLEGRERIELVRFQTFTQIIHKGIDRLFFGGGRRALRAKIQPRPPAGGICPGPPLVLRTQPGGGP